MAGKAKLALRRAKAHSVLRAAAAGRYMSAREDWRDRLGDLRAAIRIREMIRNEPAGNIASLRTELAQHLKCRPRREEFTIW